MIQLNTHPTYLRLSQGNTIIQEIPNLPRLMKIFDVEMDCYHITTRDVIGTSGLATCFAICSQDVRADGKTILALAHSCIQSVQDVLNVMKDGLAKQSCERSSIRTYIVGGSLMFEGEPTSCPDQEEETLRIADRENIVAARFNVANKDEECLSVIFMPGKVLISKTPLIEARRSGGANIDDAIELLGQKILKK